MQNQPLSPKEYFRIEVMKTLPGTDGKTPMIADGKVLV